MKILFMCVANSARSQMAEGLANKIFGNEAEIQSAGSLPTKVNSLALQAMQEIGIDISSHYSKTYEQLSSQFTSDINYIITLCAEEVCPVVANKKAHKLHWPFSDPARRENQPLANQLQEFRTVRDKIETKIQEFKKSLIQS